MVVLGLVLQFRLVLDVYRFDFLSGFKEVLERVRQSVSFVLGVAEGKHGLNHLLK